MALMSMALRLCPAVDYQKMGLEIEAQWDTGGLQHKVTPRVHIGEQQERTEMILWTTLALAVT
nr:hypothetical protein [uncultured bacterium]